MKPEFITIVNTDLIIRSDKTDNNINVNAAARTAALTVTVLNIWTSGDDTGNCNAQEDSREGKTN